MMAHFICLVMTVQVGRLSKKIFRQRLHLLFELLYSELDERFLHLMADLHFPFFLFYL